MKILFTMAHGYMPQGNGGLQKDVDQLSRELAKKGHETAVLASLMPGGAFGLTARFKQRVNQHLSGLRLARDTGLGYPVWRTWFPWGRPGHYFPRKEIHYIVDKEKPDLVVVSSGEAVRIALTIKETGVPVLMLLADNEFQDRGGRFEELGPIPCVANSRFTAEKHRQAFGVDPAVIHPFIPKEQYRTETTRENITFINPIPTKGVSIAIEIARLCPEIPFVFNEGWPLRGTQRRELLQKLGGLSNVTLAAPQSDMRKVYGKCKILLAPSVWEEGYGRIVTEAQISGIPAIASTRGGLPEAVGPGGILISPDAPIENWVAAIRKLWQDDKYYNELSTAALAHAERPEMNVAHQIDAYEKVLQGAITNYSTHEAA